MDTSRAKTPSRLFMTVAFTISALLLGIIGAVAAGTGTVAPPPKIAFVAAGGNFPDALAVGPMAGRLGAPLFLTPTESLNDGTKDALVAYDAKLIIVAGGPNTVHDAVLAQISAATGLAIKEFDDKPTEGIVRAFGTGREATAAKLADLLANYNPKFLPVDATAVGAVDADTIDGKDSTEFLGATAKAADSDKLDGVDSSAFVKLADVGTLLPVATFAVDSTGTLLFSSHRAPVTGAPTITWEGGSGWYRVELPGLSFSINDDSAICGTAAGSAYSVVTDSQPPDLLVRIFDSANAADQSWMSCAVYSND